MDGLLHYEDFPEGEVITYGRWEVTAADIVDFARDFDPQPFHLDEEAGKDSILGGLAASGWHVCAMMNRMMVDAYLGRAASMGSFGIAEMKWMRPVLAGDVLTIRRTTLDKRVSRKRPEMGILTFRFEAIDAQGTVTSEMTGTNLVRTRASLA
ncbi:MAG: MaoC family dehydratase [Parvibaculaceae bacterium]